jgi:hypothetical protein
MYSQTNYARNVSPGNDAPSTRLGLTFSIPKNRSLPSSRIGPALSSSFSIGLLDAERSLPVEFRADAPTEAYNPEGVSANGSIESAVTPDGTPVTWEWVE